MYTTLNDALRIAKEHLPPGITIAIYLTKEGCDVECTDEPGGQGGGFCWQNVKNLEGVFERAVEKSDALAKQIAEDRQCR